MAPKIFFTSQLLALANLLYLTSVHYSLKFGESGKSLCNIGEAFNCDVVNTSAYSTLIGAPISIWGLFANLILLIVGIFAGIESDEKKSALLKKLALLGAGLILIVSVVMGAISMTQLGTLCLFCVFGYALSLVTFVSARAWSRGDQDATLIDSLGLLLKKDGMAILLFLIAFPGISLLADDMFKSKYKELSSGMIRDIIADWRAQSELSFITSDALTFTGKGETKMTIVEFADFQCIHCKNAAPILHNFVRSRPGIQHIFLSFPLDGQCNPSMTRAGDGRSCKFAYANYCSAKLAGSWKIHDWLFDAFHDAKVSELGDKAEEFGLNRQDFDACMEDNATKVAIQSQAEQGERSKIKGTPAFFVNGKKLGFGQSWQVLEAIYGEL